MATLAKRKHSPFWYIQWKVDSKWQRKALPYKHTVSADTRKAREELAKLNLKEATEDRVDGDSRWDLWVDEFFENRYATRLYTKGRYQCSWKTWRIFLENRKITIPAQVNYALMMDFLKWRQNPETKGVYKCGRNNAILEIKVMGLVLQEAMRRGHVLNNVARGLGLMRSKSPEKQEITADEEVLIREKLKTQPEWMQNSFEIAMAVGCRLRETALDLNNVDFERKLIHLTQKGGRPHTTLLPPKLEPLLRKLKDEGRRFAVDIPAMPSKPFWSFFKSIGLSHLSFHCTRVTVVTRLARKNVPERVAMRFVGHASATVHRIYCKLQTEDLQSCVMALA